MSPSLNPERWKRQREIFAAAVERGAGAEEYAREQCGGDEEMYSGVCRMIEADRRSGVLDRRPELSGAQPERPLPTIFSEGQIAGRRYRIIRYLGRGGMGEVYEAEDLDIPEMKEHVALKTLLPATASDESMLARFRQEITLSRKIQHPNVCSAFDLSKHETEGSDAIWFLTMPFLPGETLATRLNGHGPMQTEEALPLLEQMAEALDAAHRAGVIHRDFKPSNVMLTPSAYGTRAVVTDFGLARRLPTVDDSTSTLSGQLMGTLDYMSPELLTGATATFRSDTYALGMTAYRMITGALPFDDQTPLAAAIRRAKQPVPAPRTFAPSLTPQWDLAIQRALDRDPSRRFSSSGHFVQALRGDPVSVTVKLPVLTRRKVIAGSAVALAAAGGGVAWSAWLKERSRPPAEAEAFYRTGVDDIHAGAYFAAIKALERAVHVAPHYALAHARLADAYAELDMSTRAGEETVSAAREGSSGLSETERLQIEAIELQITRDFAGAVAKYERLARSARSEDNDALADLARAYEKDERPAKAIEIYRRIVRGPAPHPASWLRLGVLYARQASARDSDEAFEESERLYQMTSNLEGLTQVALERGNAENTRRHLDSAAAYLNKALDRARQAGNFQQEIAASLSIALNASMAGDSNSAESYARAALETAQRYQMGEMEDRALRRLGDVFKLKREYQTAESHYNDALALARQLRSGILIATSQASLASVHEPMDRPEDAAREAEEALKFAQQNRYANLATQCLTIMARTKLKAGDYAGAMSSSRDLLQIAEKSQDKAQMALCHETIGTALFNQDRWPEALAEYRKNLELAPDSMHLGYAGMQCGNTLWRLGQYAEAIGMFRQADAKAVRFPDLQLGLIYGRTGLALSQDRYADAAASARRGTEAAGEHDRGMRASFQQLLGLASMGSGHKKEGLKLCEEALAVIEGLPNTTEVSNARVTAIQARIENGDSAGALAAFKLAEPELAARPEASWRALAFVSRADAQYAGRAAAALRGLERMWGADFQTYLARPDIQELSRPFLHSNSAKEG